MDSRFLNNAVTLTEGDKLRPLDDVLQDVFQHAIKFCDGNKTEAADGLGIGRTTFYRKMGTLGELVSQLHREKKPKKQKK